MAVTRHVLIGVLILKHISILHHCQGAFLQRLKVTPYALWLCVYGRAALAGSVAVEPLPSPCRASHDPQPAIFHSHHSHSPSQRIEVSDTTSALQRLRWPHRGNEDGVHVGRRLSVVGVRASVHNKTHSSVPGVVHLWEEWVSEAPSTSCFLC
jgi:hypothetical protein